MAWVPKTAAERLRRGQSSTPAGHVTCDQGEVARGWANRIRVTASIR
jgi:hypothetical protein